MTGLAVPAPPLPTMPPPWSVRVVEPDSADVAIVHGWMHHPAIARFWKQTWTLEEWSEKVRRHLSGSHTIPLLFSRNGIPLVYTQVYRVALDRIGEFYRYHPHDLGVHVTVDPGSIGAGLMEDVAPAIIDALFAADPECRRIIGEPNATNAAAVRSAAAFGFTPVGRITLPDKTAELMVRPRTPEDTITPDLLLRS
ncbi:acetyltransferase [Allokutzneria sp. A3M-2-11 16]|uniref:GNAT family N-acetyltransferase n=1 Tax=Allokutzneria sp. A3M-2-11 16 TaxID=2962043 RepID=UPI0020B6C126|nr:GNAT family N-acetyltransferase [Allokutzneria sp. A3M-2-11 16]MCP3801210.1 acetyltransferase [Allokutzneria sp. A3M-2-11 16]